MEEDVAASLKDVIKVLKGAPCTVKLMVVGNAACLLGARKVLKGVPHFVKGTVEENVAFTMAVGSAQRVYMGALISVLRMEVERDVLSQVVPKVRVAELIAVSGMEEGSGARLSTATRVHRVAQISARLMVEEKDATGEKENVRNSLGVRVGYVLHIVAWYMIVRPTRRV